MFKLGVGIGTEDGLRQTLCLIAEGIYIVTDFAIAEDNTHTTAFVSLGFAEDTDTRAIFLQGIHKVVVQERAVDGR